MVRTQRNDERQSGYQYYLPATPNTDGTQGPVERVLRAVFRRRGA